MSVTIEPTDRTHFLLTIREGVIEITADELAEICITGAQILAANKVRVNKKALMGIGKKAAKNVKKEETQ